MIAHSVEAQIIGGQLLPSDSLKDFEGKKVRVTLLPQEGLEPAEDIDVEKDVYVKMPLASEVIRDAIVVEGKGLKPCLIFAEELPDE